MKDAVFSKPFTQQEPLDEAAIQHVSEILRGGRLHRYNTLGDELSEAALFEEEYAKWQGTKYCLACTSGGYAMQIALRSVGVKPGDRVLANAYTLAPVPGAIHSVGAIPVFVEITEEWTIDIDDLVMQALASGARFLLLSHMRGHIADMDKVSAICKAHEIIMIEDCAHTMGAKWNDVRSGNFGKVACFSTQTYKHMNSGEGGLLTTDDEDVAARAIIHSGSYMLYERHGAAPPVEVFDRVKLETPNLSGRMDNMRAALLRYQLKGIEDSVKRWNERYRAAEQSLSASSALMLRGRPREEDFVGSSIQVRLLNASQDQCIAFMDGCKTRGVEVKWFGAAQPTGFTSKYDSWQYFDEVTRLPNTDAVLANTFDVRIPLTFTIEDCSLVGAIVAEEADALASADVT